MWNENWELLPSWSILPASSAPPAQKLSINPLEKFDQVYSVNLRGSFIMTKSVLPAMQRENYGRILLIASIAGKEGKPGHG